MYRLRKIASGLAAGAMILSTVLVASGQTPTDGATDPRIQLAAVTPGSEDLPTGFVFVGETFLDANQLGSQGFDAGALTGGGFVGQYVSVYMNPDSGDTLRSYASWWGSDEAATNGFNILEDEATANPEGTLSDGAAEIGEEPRETTTGTYQSADGSTVGTVDVTFRRGPMVIGVAHDKADAAPEDATVANDVATRMDERAQAVLNGESLPHVDMSLPTRTLSFAGENNALVQFGFLGPVETETIYGVQGSLLGGVDSSWVETTMIGSSDAGAPTVTVGVTTFSNEADAVLAVEQAEDLFAPLPDQEAVDGASVEGADAVSAFRYSSGDAGALDGYRLIFATGGEMTVVDVRGSAANGAAEAAATAIAASQVTCQTGNECTAPSLPGEFTGQ
jgi:hypothetical protein